MDNMKGLELDEALPNTFYSPREDDLLGVDEERNVDNNDDSSNILVVSNESSNYVFRDPENLPLPREVMKIEESIPTLIEVEQNLKQKYLELQKKIEVRQTQQDRATAYRGLLEEALSMSTAPRSRGYHYHPKDEKKAQHEFNSLITDDRYVEGKQYRNWHHEFETKNLKRVQTAAAAAAQTPKDNEKKESKEMDNELEEMTHYGNGIMPPNEIVAFLETITSLILKEYPVITIQNKYIDHIKNTNKTINYKYSVGKRFTREYQEAYDCYQHVLRLFLERLAFPYLTYTIAKENRLVKYPIWEVFYTKEEKEWDETFNRNCQWMRELTQQELGIQAQFCKSFASVEMEKSILKQMNSELARKNGMVHPGAPYFEAIAYFHEAMQQRVPSDILHYFLQSVHAINPCAQTYSRDPNLLLCGDDYMDVMVWVIVHSRVKDIHMRLGYIDRFVSNSVKFYGEVGMCLMLVQQATQFIRENSPKN
ncbi:hypothetical protein RFI_21218 [Reticulomyxa filosa]|uniref:VPS9 domain-containing protein n=1 Tax=Reticulomyxa filosa TaxID=46433 RepID=X6MSQ3_RETFI|nr:hypothetical protein RFI_21218 [Reticulomyxa filosa]|eukprot:ETO16140.1 hypothetical protein RFI_21218 [Reticulomyxa filosa]